MEILAKYIHGSEDSTDIDVVYVVDAMPDKAECKRFCSEDSNENRNLITIKDGAVSEVYKGTVGHQPPRLKTSRLGFPETG